MILFSVGVPPQSDTLPGREPAPGSLAEVTTGKTPHLPETTSRFLAALEQPPRDRREQTRDTAPDANPEQDAKGTPPGARPAPMPDPGPWNRPLPEGRPRVDVASPDNVLRPASAGPVPAPPHPAPGRDLPATSATPPAPDTGAQAAPATAARLPDTRQSPNPVQPPEGGTPVHRPRPADTLQETRRLHGYEARPEAMVPAARSAPGAMVPAAPATPIAPAASVVPATPVAPATPAGQATPVVPGMPVTPAEASTQRATDEDNRRQIMVARPPAPRQDVASTPPAPAIPAPARHDHEIAAIVSTPAPTRAAVPLDTILATPARQVIPAAQGATESRPGGELPRPVPVADAEPARTAPPTRAERSQPSLPPLAPASAAMGPEPDRPLLAAAETTSPGISTHRSDAPATNSQPPATIPEAPRPVPQQISAAVHALGASGSTEIRLSPDELGQVRMTLLPDGDTMRVAFTAERPETLDLLRRHVSDLAAELRGLGYHSAEFSFGGDPRGDSQRRARPDGPRSYAETPSAVTIRPEPDAASRSTLDLRL